MKVVCFVGRCLVLVGYGVILGGSLTMMSEDDDDAEKKENEKGREADLIYPFQSWPRICVGRDGMDSLLPEPACACRACRACLRPHRAKFPIGIGVRAGTGRDQTLKRPLH